MVPPIQSNPARIIKWTATLLSTPPLIPISAFIPTPPAFFLSLPQPTPESKSFCLEVTGTLWENYSIKVLNFLINY
jgi:hypothetical protein